MRSSLMGMGVTSALLTLVPGVQGALAFAAPQPSTPMSDAGPVASSVPEPAFSWGGYFEAIGVMLLLLGALWFLLWAIRRYGKFNFLPPPGGLARDALRMEAQLPLGPKRSLVVVRFLNERLLLGVTDQQISVLSAHLLREVDPAASETASASGSDTLATERPSAACAQAFADLLREKREVADETVQRA